VYDNIEAAIDTFTAIKGDMEFATDEDKVVKLLLVTESQPADKLRGDNVIISFNKV
jgi:hypothetical protein